ncbi:MAG: flavodoxin family protein [Patescibacteria group bacterium]
MAKQIFILGINGSPRKTGTTAQLVKMVLKSCERNGAKVFYIDLIDKKIKPCLGCYSNNPKSCKYPCNVKDDMQEIYKLLLKADGMIWGSPSYWFSVSGIMKNFLDRLSCLENSGFLLAGKVVGIVTDGEETGSEEVANYLLAFANVNGMISPPCGAAFFNTRYKGSWMLKDLEIMADNIVRLCKIFKKNKLNLNWKLPD